jgi:septal ring factor EnvC (AmiA/AmiB activator)
MLGQPMAPTYDPAALAAQQPYSAPPVSGAYGYAYAPVASAIPAPPASRSKATIAFASAAVVFLLVAGVFTTMFVFKNAEASDLSGQVTTLTGDRDGQRTKVESLTKELNNTKRDLTDSDEELKKLTEQKKALTDCLNAIYDLDSAAVAANGQRTAEVNAKLDEVDRLCTIADRYL